MAELVLRKLCKSFGRLQVIHEVDLTVRDGEFCVFVGPSGCGKSTLLRLIAGLEDATSGEISIDGERVEAAPPAKRGVAMVFQSYALYPHMTARKNMAFGLELAKKGRAAVAEAVEKAAEILQLSQYLDRLPRELSGGQRQRVAIGRAIVRDPKLFLFDEPLSNLDAALRVQTRIEIAKLHKDMGATTIYVTHDQVEAMTLADKIVVLREGRVEQVGAPLELYHRPANRFVAGFIGSPRMNFLDVQVLGASSEGVRVALPGGAEVVAEVSAEGVSEGETLVLGVRPEHVGSAVEAGKTAFGAAPAREKGASGDAAEREKAAFSDAATKEKPPSDGVAATEKGASETVAAVEKPGSGGGAEGGKPGSGAPLTGRVEVVESLGDSHLLHLDLADGQRIILRGPGDPEAAEGETLPLRVAGRDCHLFRGDGSALRRLD